MHHSSRQQNSDMMLAATTEPADCMEVFPAPLSQISLCLLQTKGSPPMFSQHYHWLIVKKKKSLVFQDLFCCCLFIANKTGLENLHFSLVSSSFYPAKMVSIKALFINQNLRIGIQLKEPFLLWVFQITKGFKFSFLQQSFQLHEHYWNCSLLWTCCKKSRWKWNKVFKGVVLWYKGKISS